MLTRALKLEYSKLIKCIQLWCCHVGWDLLIVFGVLHVIQIHQHEVNKYNFKNTDFIYISYHIQFIDISLENYRFVRVRTRSNWFSKLLATPDL